MSDRTPGRRGSDRPTSEFSTAQARQPDRIAERSGGAFAGRDPARPNWRARMQNLHGWIQARQPGRAKRPSGRSPGILIELEARQAVVLVAHGEAACRLDPRHRDAARRLAKAGIAVLAFDLLDIREACDPSKALDIERLAGRFLEAIRWVKRQPRFSGLPIGLLAAQTGAAAAIRAACIDRDTVQAIVCRGGRPDRLGDLACGCGTAVLYVVGGQGACFPGRSARAPPFSASSRLEVIEGASPACQESGAFETVTALAEGWFLEHLVHPRQGRPLAIGGRGCGAAG